MIHTGEIPKTKTALTSNLDSLQLNLHILGIHYALEGGTVRFLTDITPHKMCMCGCSHKVSNLVCMQLVLT